MARTPGPSSRNSARLSKTRSSFTSATGDPCRSRCRVENSSTRSNEPPDLPRVRTTVAGLQVKSRLSQNGAWKSGWSCSHDSLEPDHPGPRRDGREAVHPRASRDRQHGRRTACSRAEILKAYPYLEAEDIREAIAYAASRIVEDEGPVGEP